MAKIDRYIAPLVPSTVLEDAARWRALMSCELIHFIGSGGIVDHKTTPMVKEPPIVLGLELHSHHIRPKEGSSPADTDGMARACLLTLVDFIRKERPDIDPTVDLIEQDDVSPVEWSEPTNQQLAQHEKYLDRFYNIAFLNELIPDVKEPTDLIQHLDKPWHELGFDSLNNVLLSMEVEDEFNIEIPNDALERINTLRQLLGYIMTDAGVLTQAVEQPVEAEDSWSIPTDAMIRSRKGYLDDLFAVDRLSHLNGRRKVSERLECMDKPWYELHLTEGGLSIFFHEVEEEFDHGIPEAARNKMSCLRDLLGYIMHKEGVFDAKIKAPV